MKLPSEISNCLCDIGGCKEKGKVCWENDGGQYYHIRVDGCIEYLHERKKADCAILHPTHKGEIYAFIIEVKTSYYDLDEVKEKIENTLNVLDNILDYSIIPIPIVYAESHKVLRRFERYAFQKRIRYKGRSYLIAFLKYCEKIQNAVTQ
jgi:hypothetical protein